MRPVFQAVAFAGLFLAFASWFSANKEGLVVAWANAGMFWKTVFGGG